MSARTCAARRDTLTRAPDAGASMSLVMSIRKVARFLLAAVRHVVRDGPEDMPIANEGQARF